MAEKGEPAEVLAKLLANESEWPRFELWRYIQQQQEEDYVRAGEGPESSRATRLMEYVLDNSSWKTVGQLLAQGNRNPAALRQASEGALFDMAPKTLAAQVAAAKRMETLREASQRIASATRVEKAPVIDGKADEACWAWNGQKPWFMRNSAMPFPCATDFAFAYDAKNLYVAVRCGDQSKEDYDFYWKQRGETAARYGFRTKDIPSVHLYLDLAGGRAGEPGKMAAYYCSAPS